MGKRKILVITTTDNMIWQFLLPHIKHLKEQGNIVECACAKTGFFFDELVNKFDLTVHEINFSRFPFTFKNIKGYKKLKNLCGQEKYDLIYCHQPVGGVMGRMMGKKFKTPVVYIAHGFHFFKGAPVVNNLLYKSIEKHYSKYTDALVTMNEEDFSNAKKFKAKHAYKINGIGVDLKKYKREKSDEKLKKSLGLKKEDIVFLSVGELNKNKNFATSIKAFSKIKNKKAKYLLCGQGALKADFEKEIQKYKMEDRVKLLGFRSDITKIYNISDVFVMTSFREGLPKAMMEAMSYGLPVVCSDIRGCKDLIKQNKGGLLFNPKDAEGFKKGIEILSEDKKLREKMGKENQKNIQNFSTEKVISQLDKIFKNIKTPKSTNSKYKNTQTDQS